MLAPIAPIPNLKVLSPNKAKKSQEESDRPTQESISGLLDFTCKTNPRYKPSWFHEKICTILDDVVRGKIRRLILAMPPRHGKSELVSRRLPAYLLGLNPNAQAIATSYSADLAARNNRDVQRIISDPGYASIFPETKLSGKNARNSAQFAYLRNNDIFEVVGHRGSYRAAGVGGGITGMGFGGEMSTDIYGNPVVGGIGIIDDYFKNRAEADSPTYREKVWEWYTSTFRTRCEDDAPIVVIATQWHEDGLIGRLIRNAQSDPNADQWTVIKFPAIQENDPSDIDPRKYGEELWPEKYSREELEKIRVSIGSYDWSALYQQNPKPKGGGTIQTAWIRKRDRLPDKIDRWILSVDAKFKKTGSGSFAVVQAWAQSGADLFIFDQWRERLGFVQTKNAILSMRERWMEDIGYPSAILIEDKASGPAIIDELSNIPGIIPIQTDGSKEARLEASSGYFEAGNVYVVEGTWSRSEHSTPQLWIDELTSFPFAATDDQCDGASQAIRYLQRKPDWEKAYNTLTLLS